MYEELSALDSVRLNFSHGSQMVINVALAVIMFGVALGIKLQGFKRVFAKPKMAVVGLVSQWFLLPALTFVLTMVFRKYIPPGVAIGMILVASCPGGNISNFISSIARSNVELSVTLTSVSTLGSVFFTPFNFMFWGSLYAKANDLVRPLEIPFGEMFKILMLLLGVPMALGLFFSWKYPQLAKKMIKPFKIAGIVFFLLLIALAFAANFRLFLRYIRYIFVIVLVHNALALSGGYFLAWLFGLKKADRRTVSIETGIQNSGLALALLFNPQIFPPELNLGGMMFVAGWWGIWHIVSGLLVAKYWYHSDLRLLKRRNFFKKAKTQINENTKS